MTENWRSGPSWRTFAASTPTSGADGAAPAAAGQDWRSLLSSTAAANPLAMETVEERDRRLTAEQEAREARSLDSVEAQLAALRATAEENRARREKEHGKEMERLAREREKVLSRSKLYDALAEREVVAPGWGKVSVSQFGEHNKELELAEMAERERQHADAVAAEERAQRARDSALMQQMTNPLGLLRGEPAARPVAAPTAPPQSKTSFPALAADGGAADELPPYTAENRSAVYVFKEDDAHPPPPPMDDPDAPPVYSPQDLFERQELLEDPSYVPEPPVRGTDALRCDSCWDPIVRDDAQNKSGRAVKHKDKTYCSECYFTRAAEKCNECGVPLVRNDIRGLSGEWGVYRGGKYHVECFNSTAGPRCAHCFDVIFANPERGLSGYWVTGPEGKLLHQECYLKQLADNTLCPKASRPPEGPRLPSHPTDTRPLGQFRNNRSLIPSNSDRPDPDGRPTFHDGMQASYQRIERERQRIEQNALRRGHQPSAADAGGEKCPV